MKSIPSYGKILTLGSAMTEDALTGHVVVQEKVDGSLFGFGINEDGEVIMRSKGLALTEDNHADMFAKAVEFVMKSETYAKLRSRVPLDTYFYCEFLQGPKHNTLKYSSVPKNNLVLFDVLSRGAYVKRDDLEHLAKEFEIDVIPELLSGILTADQIPELLKTESYLGGEILEGIVIKNYDQTIMLGGQVFPLFTKYVREGFKERHTVDWKIRQPKDSLATYIDGFRNEARWQKAIIHAKEKGLIEQSPRDIGVLIKMIQSDIKEEEEQNIKNYLYKCFIDDIMRKSVSKFPEWYKDELLKNVKNETESNIS